MIGNDRFTEALRYLVENIKLDAKTREDSRKHESVKQATQAIIAYSIEEAMKASHFRYGEGVVMVYDGRRYRAMDDKEFESMILKVLRQLQVGGPYVVTGYKKITTYLIAALADRPFTPERRYISFRNMVYDMDADVTMPHNPIIQTAIYLDFEFDPQARCPRWMQFLSEVVPSEEKMRMLQEFCGAIFVDRNKYKIEQIMYLLGSGANGKGVFTNTIRKMLREDAEGNVSLYSAAELFVHGTREYNIAACNGKLVNICEDMSRADFSGGDFKKFVSGEPFQCRFAYGRPFTASQIPLMMASINEIPDTKDQSFGHFRRPWIVRFDVQIPKDRMDTQLGNKLMDEFSGIFIWMLGGRKRFIENGGKFSESAEAAIEIRKMQYSVNNVLQYLEDRGYRSEATEGSEPERMYMTDIYSDYTKFANDNGGFRYGSKKMNSMLISEGFIKGKDARGVYFFVHKGGVPEFVPFDEAPPIDKQHQKSILDDELDDLPF